MVEISEEKMQRFAGRDARLQIRLREIGSWYLSKREMYAEAEAIVENLTETEERSLFGRGGRKHPLQVLLWAADQADSPVRAVARKWVAFTIFATANLAPRHEGIGASPSRAGPGPPCSGVGHGSDRDSRGPGGSGAAGDGGGAASLRSPSRGFINPEGTSASSLSTPRQEQSLNSH